MEIRLSLFRQVAVRRAFEVVGLVVAVGSSAQAQYTPPLDPHRWGVQLAGDLGSIAVINTCHEDDGVPAYGVGLSVLHRFRDRFVAIADIRGSGAIPITGCKLSLPGPKLIGPNEYENAPKNSYPRGFPNESFARSGVRIGIESWQGYPMARALIGGGLFWGSQTPFATAGIEMGTRGDGARLTFGLETSRAWIREDQLFTRFRWDGTTQTPMPSRTDSHIQAIGWTMIHLGLELPLR
jgi:hypothetical protein